VNKDLVNVTAPVARSHQRCEKSAMDEAAGDLAACVQRVRQRDEDAARQFMERLYPLVLKVVRAHLPQRSSEEDLVQTVFMKAFANIDQFQGRVPVTHWVSRIAVNTCLNALKAEKARPELRWSDLSEEAQHVVESLACEDGAARTTQGLVARELLHKLLARLNPPDRLVVTLLHLEEKSVAEVQAVTGWSAALVKVRAFRARKRLQKFLQQLEDPK
jgi:RNA polymerase sigma-70 factor (ECF subfamily)